MKKTLIVAAVSSSFAVAAHAQSSVTLYGVLDAGITYTSNVGGHSNWQQTSGGIDQSRFGLRGAEDLGNGLKAIFTLESGFNLGNGKFANNNGMFNRQAFVGLSSNYGTVTLGRQYDAEQDFLAPLTATGSWGGTSFAHFGNLDNLNTNGGSAVNNSIKFTSANYSGLQFGGTYGFSNQTGFNNNREYSVGAAYQFQGLRIAASYAQEINPFSTTGGATDSSFANSAFGLSSLGNFRLRTYGAGASYAFGPAQVGVVWTQARVDNATAIPLSLRQNNYEANAKYNLTPALGLGVAYTYTNQNVSGVSQHFHQVGAQADYSLSKRTDVYAQVVYQRASGPAGTTAFIYNPTTGSGFSSSINQTAATVGLRHRF
ncbi:porin [Trinickia sp. EG282A]|uniref:porin n=1 Tax=Trinickia sp. EG282A TaxID=3237013 RepID=UPI0034D1CB24